MKGYRVTHQKRCIDRVFSCAACEADCLCFHRALRFARAAGHGALVHRVSDGALLSEVRNVGGTQLESKRPLRKGRVNRQWGDNAAQRAQLKEVGT